jgi:4-oxalocrotonate tautomerase
VKANLGPLVAAHLPFARRSTWVEDVFTPEQKGQIVERLTNAMVSIEGENMRNVTWVVVEEVRSGDWGIGGKPLHTEDVKALAAGAPT